MERDATPRIDMIVLARIALGIEKRTCRTCRWKSGTECTEPEWVHTRVGNCSEANDGARGRWAPKMFIPDEPDVEWTEIARAALGIDYKRCVLCRWGDDNGCQQPEWLASRVSNCSLQNREKWEPIPFVPGGRGAGTNAC